MQKTVKEAYAMRTVGMSYSRSARETDTEIWRWIEGVKIGRRRDTWWGPVSNQRGFCLDPQPFRFPQLLGCLLTTHAAWHSADANATRHRAAIKASDTPAAGAIRPGWMEEEEAEKNISVLVMHKLSVCGNTKADSNSECQAGFRLLLYFGKVLFG